MHFSMITYLRFIKTRGSQGTLGYMVTRQNDCQGPIKDSIVVALKRTSMCFSRLNCKASHAAQLGSKTGGSEVILLLALLTWNEPCHKQFLGSISAWN